MVVSARYKHSSPASGLLVMYLMDKHLNPVSPMIVIRPNSTSSSYKTYSRSFYYNDNTTTPTKLRLYSLANKPFEINHIGIYKVKPKNNNLKTNKIIKVIKDIHKKSSTPIHQSFFSKIPIAFYLILFILIYIGYLIFFSQKHFLFNLFFILGLNSLFLTLLNINILLQILIFILFLIFSWLGLLLFGNLRKKIPDTIMLLCISSVIGMIIFRIT